MVKYTKQIIKYFEQHLGSTVETSAIDQIFSVRKESEHKLLM